jgi:hypothetical protein
MYPSTSADGADLDEPAVRIHVDDGLVDADEVLEAVTPELPVVRCVGKVGLDLVLPPF